MMRNPRRSVVFLLLLVLCLPIAAREWPIFLLTYWPTARSAALAGSCVAPTDAPDAVFFNPGGLGLQRGIWAWAGCWDWLGWCDLRWGGAGYAFEDALGPGNRLLVGANFMHALWEQSDVVGPGGELYGSYHPWEGVLGLHAAASLGDALGSGLSIKVYHDQRCADWVPESLGMNLDCGATTFAVDGGVLYRPSALWSVGLSFANLGPALQWEALPETHEQPLNVRLGAATTPIDNPFVRLRGAAALALFPRDVPDDSLWHDLWKSAGAEMTLLQLVTARVGYVSAKTWWREGFTFGFGVGYKDYIRLDVANVDNIYSFNRELSMDWRVSLVVNDAVGLVRDEILGRGGLDWAK